MAATKLNGKEVSPDAYWHHRYQEEVATIQTAICMLQNTGKSEEDLALTFEIVLALLKNKATI